MSTGAPRGSARRPCSRSPRPPPRLHQRPSRRPEGPRAPPASRPASGLGAKLRLAAPDAASRTPRARRRPRRLLLRVARVAAHVRDQEGSDVFRTGPSFRRDSRARRVHQLAPEGRSGVLIMRPRPVAGEAAWGEEGSSVPQFETSRHEPTRLDLARLHALVAAILPRTTGRAWAEAMQIRGVDQGGHRPSVAHQRPRTRWTDG
jgi:hypothetical protein